MPCGTPSKAYTNSAPDQQSLYPDGQHTLAFFIKCVPPVGLQAGFAVIGKDVQLVSGYLNAETEDLLQLCTCHSVQSERLKLCADDGKNALLTRGFSELCLYRPLELNGATK